MASFAADSMRQSCRNFLKEILYTVNHLHGAPDPDIVPPEVEVVLPDDAVDLDDLPIEDSLDILGTGNSIVGGGGGGRGRRGGGLGEGEDLRAFGDSDSPFRGFVDDIRGRGLDVVFVIDATGSMQRFIDRARDTIDDRQPEVAIRPSLRSRSRSRSMRGL